LRIRYAPSADGPVAARWTPNRTWEGFPGIVHGGIVSTILDEAMSKAVAASGCKALTAELKVRFRRPVPLDRELAIRGWVLDRRKRRIRTEAVVTSPDGEEFAHAWGVFLTMEAGAR
jgi:acyl-coenzyme A thioesterase PaaI-like protein